MKPHLAKIIGGAVDNTSANKTVNSFARNMPYFQVSKTLGVELGCAVLADTHRQSLTSKPMFCSPDKFERVVDICSCFMPSPGL